MLDKPTNCHQSPNGLRLGVGAMNKSRATLPIMANTAQWLNNCLSCQHRPPLGVGATAQGIAWVQWFGMGR
ncbi:hypothetical protein NKT77_10040 [Moraxella sp. FZLJ2107]|uniref:hypothetical protein n=1 Tax=unclassified Moraxella TaxID=2685852 RepID=UPI0020C83FF9|nr:MULTISPECIES: hypothetical protein [unclassified Moraxella]UTO04780.1 hypothetical protein NKT77_09800 [Moraxella sp. FZLJ2107]UTO04784.1 hypothetical protein NKT77_09820 [Moraxella sp. FZLJ2107]UTO04828.1 hypothetical protein NKT77_10040 [Moraxella sp. FZLJ2107]UTO21501.1 hypothetical protein NKU06_06550 [Moraxella sp. FZLJ2109]UTO21512.1 hypothetical protein NKU06_06605 [Moraxella sp. FZLJ2109]